MSILVVGKWVLLAVVILGLIVGAFMLTYKVAKPNTALVITGGKAPIIKVAGGGIVIPIIRKHGFFNVDFMTVEARGDEVFTKSAVPVIVNWTAQVKPNIENEEDLMRAVTGFFGRSADEIKSSVKLTLDGGMREVVSSLTPEEVLRDKNAFSSKVMLSVADEIANMGYKLVSLNIQEVTDRNSYYERLAASDREAKRREAENITAEATQSIREKKAITDQEAREKELASELAIAEKTRNNEVLQAQYQQNSAKEQAKAEMAGELQMAEIQKDLALKNGEVEVERQRQLNRAATEEKGVVQTKAEAQKRQVEIDSAAKAEQAKILAEGHALAAEAEARGVAAATKTKAGGDAEAVKMAADAEAARVSRVGIAEAEVTKLKGLAEAEAIKARALAQADGEKAMAEALSAHDEVNLKVEMYKIEQNARVEIATNTAKIMADLGTNARFVSFGGENKPGGGSGGNVLLNTISGIPEVLAKANIMNSAVSEDNRDFNSELHELVRGIAQAVRDNPAAMSAVAREEAAASAQEVGAADVHSEEDGLRNKEV